MKSLLVKLSFENKQMDKQTKKKTKLNNSSITYRRYLGLSGLVNVKDSMKQPAFLSKSKH